MENLNSIRKVLKSSTQRLKKNSDTPDLDCEILLAYFLKKERSFLLANLDKEINDKQYEKFQNLLDRRLKNEPIAYIINNKEFYGLNFYVDKNVLIPRPETELIIESVINVVNDRFQRTRRSNTLNILDIGTGSGCIAISLAKNIPRANITACDVSKKALKVARLNAKKNKVINNIKFHKSNLLDSIAQKNKFDFIIANLPYVSEKQYENLKDNVKKYEPKKALVANNYGMEFYIKLLKQIPNYIKKGGCILLEIDPSFTEKITKEVMNILNIKRNRIKIKPDLFGLSRVLMIKL